jgi:hypothetical protein
MSGELRGEWFEVERMRGEGRGASSVRLKGWCEVALASSSHHPQRTHPFQPPHHSLLLTTHTTDPCNLTRPLQPLSGVRLQGASRGVKGRVVCEVELSIRIRQIHCIYRTYRTHRTRVSTVGTMSTISTMKIGVTSS